MNFLGVKSLGFCRNEHFYFSPFLSFLFGEALVLSPTPALPLALAHGQRGEAQVLTQGRAGSGDAQVGAQPGRAIFALHLILSVP